MKEISDNDYRALELMRELFELKANMEDHIATWINQSLEIPKQYKVDKDRVERIEFVLEAWSKGEDVIVAMLADPRDADQARREMNL